MEETNIILLAVYGSVLTTFFVCVVLGCRNHMIRGHQPLLEH